MTPSTSAPLPEEEQPAQEPAEIKEELSPEETPAEAEAAAKPEELIEPEPEAMPAEETVVAETAVPQPPSRMQLLLRKIGIWAAITLGVFVIFGLLAYFQIYRPVKQNVAVLEGQLAAAKTEVAAVEADAADAEERFAASQAELEISNARVNLYQALNGVTAAQAALDKKNGQDALKALKETQAALTEMLPVVAKESPEVADQMDTRLKAAISSLSGDFKTTKADLETLSALLLQQDKIFTGK
jgi:hypothetical protein